MFFGGNLRAWVVLGLALGQMATVLWPLTGLGVSIQDRSDSLPTPLVPIGWTFSIWGLIYLSASAYAVWQFLPRNRNHALNHRVGWLIAYMYLVNTSWQVWVSVWGFGWIDFLALGSEAAVGTVVLFRMNQLPRLGWGAVLTAVWSIALLTGWTTAASFVGSTVSASAMGFEWATDVTIGKWILSTAIGFSVILTLAHRHWVYAAAITWASWGVYNNAQIKNLASIEQISSYAVMIIGASTILVLLWRGRSRLINRSSD